jgi:hypothetical protein
MSGTGSRGRAVTSKAARRRFGKAERLRAFRETRRKERGERFRAALAALTFLAFHGQLLLPGGRLVHTVAVMEGDVGTGPVSPSRAGNAQHRPANGE